MTDRSEDVEQDDEPQGMGLTPSEAKVYALWLASRHLSSAEWLLWEDVPNLGEYAFEGLERAVDEVSVLLDREWRRLAIAYNVDPAFLHEKTTHFGSSGERA